GIPLPHGRTALFFVVLWTLLLGSALASEFMPRRPNAILLRGVGIGVLVAVGAYYVGCLRLSYFKEWKFDADTKQVYWLISDLHEHCGIANFVTDWRYSNALNFYRAAYRNYKLSEFPFTGAADLPTGQSGYIVYYPTSEEFIK